MSPSPRGSSSRPPSLTPPKVRRHDLGWINFSQKRVAVEAAVTSPGADRHARWCSWSCTSRLSSRTSRPSRSPIRPPVPLRRQGRAERTRRRRGCSSAPTTSRRWTAAEGHANFAMRFPDCKKQCTVSFDARQGAVPRDTITAEDSGAFVPIMGFDCRGLELTKWQPTEGLRRHVQRGEHVVGRTSTSGADPDGWFEYCEKCGESVGIHGAARSSSGRTRPNRRLY